MSGFQNLRQNKGGENGERVYQNRNRSNYQQNGDGQQRYPRGNNPNYNNNRSQSNEAYQANVDDFRQQQAQSGSSPNSSRQSSSYHPYRR